MEPGWYPLGTKPNGQNLDPRKLPHHSDGNFGPWMRKDLLEKACLWVVEEWEVGIKVDKGRFTKIGQEHIDAMQDCPKIHDSSIVFLCTVQGVVICIFAKNPGKSYATKLNFSLLICVVFTL